MLADVRVVLLASAAALCAPTCAQALPNIVIVYADDLGYGDLSCYNADAAYKTPHLDRMAAEGVRFTDAHSPSTICSPSRYGLLSGQQIYRSTGRGGGGWRRGEVRMRWGRARRHGRRQSGRSWQRVRTRG